MDTFVPTETGHWVNERFAQIAEVIQDYDSEMYLAWIPPERRIDNSPPYAVIHHPANLGPYVMFHLNEDELDHRVLARIFRGDISKNDVIADIEASDRAKKVLELKQELERKEARLEFIKSVIKSKKHVYRHNGVRYE